MMKIQSTLTLTADHPVFAGHFPGKPIVPGVLLLDAILHAIAETSGHAATAWQINAVKFLSPLVPDEAFSIAHEAMAQGIVKFEVVAADRKIVSGSLLLLGSRI